MGQRPGAAGAGGEGGANRLLLSRSERQSLELAEKCKTWVDGCQGVMADYFPRQAFGGVGLVPALSGEGHPRGVPLRTSMLQHEIRFPNKSRIIALAANPDTARGYTGHVLLDEFAFHADAEAIFKAAYRQTTLGYKLKVLSTPNGQEGKFWELAKLLGLDTGVRPRRQPVKASDKWRVASGKKSDSPLATDHLPLSPWSGHWCDVYLAAEEGAPIDIQATRAGCDEETWYQEYCCQFVSQASEWISPELFQSCISSEASTELRVGGQKSKDRGGDFQPSAFDSQLYAGWDIARKRDLSVIWISELVGDVTWTRGVIELSNMATPDQIREARALLSGFSPSADGQDSGVRGYGLNPESRILNPIRRMSVDMSGMGLAIVEQLAREFPDVVEGVQFTAPVKEHLAVLARRRMEEGKVRLPELASARHAFRAVRKSVNAAGQARFDAGHDSEYGHGDHFWAFAFAEAAAESAFAARRRAPSAEGASPVFVGRPRDTELLPLQMETVF
ncbi:MAG: hypothetical protein DMG21_08630 [Acidobacteria bacterium]|nr:MAG: hypothetical protein DMG21_08630 [Acidobacteriota bacterium]